MQRIILPALTLLAACLVLSGTGAAIYIETPLQLGVSDPEAEVGDDLDLTIGPSPDNASARHDWASKRVKIGYSFDRNEGNASDPDAPVDDSGYLQREIGELVLDGDAQGTLTWRVPAELDGKNVNLFVENEDGGRLAFTYLAVGDAPPVMRITGGFDGEPEIDGSGTTRSEDDDPQEAAALGAIGLLFAIGAVAVGVARRRR